MSPPPVVIANVLADRYASQEMATLWSAENKVVLERRFWVAVLEAQHDAGLDVGPEAIGAYRAVVEDVDLVSIRRREEINRHDVKARIEEFCALAGYEDIHKGLTSRDLTENVEQLQIVRGLHLIRGRVLAVLKRLGERASEYESLVVAGRTHNVPAQATSLGKRFANVAEELLIGLERLDGLLERYPLRGIKGPVGTQLDQLELLGSAEAVAHFEHDIAARLGFDRVLDSVGQVYPRSLDFDVVSALLQVASGLANLGLMVRLMAGTDSVTEGFKDGQVGSSAMPHKMNTRSTERIGGFMTILRGHLAMASSLAGDQWNEGDVSCSVVRRVMLPDSFFAAEGALLTTITVLDEFGAYPDVVSQEFEKYLPFLATTKLLVAAVQLGEGREITHEVIKEHAVSAALAMRTNGTEADRDLFARLGADDRYPLGMAEISNLIGEPTEFVGLASAQIAAVLRRIGAAVATDPEAAGFVPRPLL
ncbi:MAG: adenylosuccinate lyase [Actinobacteria bacterium]|nr:adenylosuccinate lyase [Actinomycetota bacterium]